jgi:hypothetical protein
MDRNPPFQMLALTVVIMLLTIPNASGFNFGLADYVITIEQPRRVALADINKDGRLDIVATHNNVFDGAVFNSRLSVLLASADGSGFDAPLTQPIPSVNEGNFVVFDADADGQLDVMVESLGSSVVRLLRGLGNGEFAVAIEFATEDRAQWLLANDFNADGRPDLAYSGVFGLLGLLLNDGQGGFDDWQALDPIGFVGGPMASGDLNADGRQDLVVTSAGGGNVAVLLGSADGIPSNPQFLSIDAASLDGVAVGDVDGDGLPDMVFSGTGTTTATLRPEDQGLWTILNQGAGSFAEPVFDEMFEASDIRLADLNGDGHLDVAGAVLSDSSVAVKLNDGAGGWQRRRDWNTTFLPTDLAIGDFDGDGRPDLVTPSSVAQPEGDFTLLRNLGNGEFAAREDYRLPGTSNALSLADLSGDGVPDLLTGLIRSGPNFLSIARGDGARGFAPADLLAPLGSFGAYRPVDHALADFNDDGHFDVVLAMDGPPNAALVALNDGSGQFDVASDVLLMTTGRPHGVAIGDFNNDGLIDVAVPNSSIGNVDLSIFFNLGNNNWGSEQRYATQGVPIFPVVGDLDGDGWLDVVVGNQSSDVLSIFRNNQGLFTLETMAPGGRAWHLQLIDFNDDNAVDLLFGLEGMPENGNSSAAIMLNDGSGNLGTPLIQSSPNTLAVRAGDLDGDDLLDLVGIGSRGIFTTYRGQGNASFEPAISRRGASGNGGGDVRIIDLDGDGKLEVITGDGHSVAVYVLDAFITDLIFRDGFEAE